MSAITTKSIAWLPAAADMVSLTYSTPGSVLWLDGPWVELAAATASAIQPAALAFDKVTAPATNWDIEVDLGIGAAASEAVIGTFRIAMRSGDTGNGDTCVPLPWALDGMVPAGVRVAARMRSNNTTLCTLGFALGYYTDFDADEKVRTQPSVLPSRATGVTLTPSGSSWGNSAYAELSSALANRAQLAWLAPVSAISNMDGEFDVATGAAGAETVLGTIGICGAGVTEWVSAVPDRPIDMAAGARLTVRLRKEGTNTTAWRISAQLYSDPLQDDQEVTFDNAVSTIGLTWLEWRGKDGVTRAFSKVALPDPADYYEGYRE